MKAKLGDIEIQIYSYDYNDAGHLFCLCRVPNVQRLIPVLASLIDVC